jgi:phospholipid/cholesterol/gamma-HCH transport system ATP-binding protein
MSSFQSSLGKEDSEQGQMIAEPILEVIDLVKTYPHGRTVLNGVCFRVFPEETFVILGGSGCGKSTLLNILIGVLPPTAGQVRIFGQNIHQLNGAQLRQIHLRCGMLFQSGALIESLSLLENIYLPLKEHYRGVPADVLWETARLKLRMVGLEEHGQKRPSGISGGMKKRVALARALALDPSLVFADEPTSGLDPVSTYEIDDLFIRLTRRIGAAAVIVTHDIASFSRVADRAIMLGSERDLEMQGRVIFQGRQADFHQSDNQVVRRFLSLGRSDTTERSRTAFRPTEPQLT